MKPHVRTFLAAVLPLAFLTCSQRGLTANAAAPRNETSPLKPGRDSPDRVETRPDGTVLLDGKPLEGQEAEGLKLSYAYAQDHKFSASWQPMFLYRDERQIFVAHLPAPVFTVRTADRLVTGLATTPGADLVAIALTGAEGSSVRLMWLDQARAVRRVADADAASDCWYRAPMSLSPAKRWLLVTKTEGRAAALAAAPEGQDAPLGLSQGGTFLVDCLGERAQAALLPDAELISCVWSPDGKLAACTVQPSAGDAPRPVLVDAESGTARWTDECVDPRAPRADPHALPGRREPGEVGDHHATPGAALPATAGPLAPVPEDSVLWMSSPLSARAVARGGREEIEISDARGRTRLSPAPAGIHSILGWSADGKLLAYLGRDSSLYLCSGAVSGAGYEAFVSCDVPTSEDDPDSLRKSFGLETRVSPLQVSLGEHPMSAWGSTDGGPFLAYLDHEPQYQVLKALRFETMSLADFGLKLDVDLRTQMAEQSLMAQLLALQYALPRYADEHDGTLPAHRSGPGLEADLKPYLSQPGRLRRISSPDEVAVELLRPGEDLSKVRDQAQKSPGTPIKLARVVENGIGTCTLVIVSTAPPGGRPELLYDVILDRGPGREQVSYNRDIVGIPAGAGESPP